MICKQCGNEYKQRWPDNCIKNHLCAECNDIQWKKFAEEESYNINLIDKIVAEGHSEHCACRQVWGDGECECSLYGKGYDPYRWMKEALQG